jgi:hypothetical protein
MAERSRWIGPVTLGAVLDMGGPLATGSAMSAFFLFEPPLEPVDLFRDINVGTDLPINVLGCYPIFDRERSFIVHRGINAFWNLDCELTDVDRAPAATC